MKQEIKDVIINSESNALATTGPHGINVVPISVVEVQESEIYLYDFFMSRTAKNIQAESSVAFTCWKDFVGVQIKAEALYETEGERYEAAVTEMKQKFPDRTLKALIRLVPSEIYDVAPGAISDNKLD